MPYFADFSACLGNLKAYRVDRIGAMASFEGF
jgi:hypothetical protein